MTDFETSEQADWSAALAGDPAAFARVFDRHRDVVFRQALAFHSRDCRPSLAIERM